VSAEEPDRDETIGTLPLSLLTERPSKSALAAKRQEVLRDLSLSPAERVKKALVLGMRLRKIAEAHGHPRGT
jgi:hypothetical protein